MLYVFFFNIHSNILKYYVYYCSILLFTTHTFKYDNNALSNIIFAEPVNNGEQHKNCTANGTISKRHNLSLIHI